MEPAINIHFVRNSFLFSRSHEPDIFSLETVCKVVAPDFIHDQNSQRIDFGQVPIGESQRRILTIQNLRC